MDENSEAHMETDVSSTTGDVIEVQEVSGSHSQVETTIEVEEVKDEIHWSSPKGPASQSGSETPNQSSPDKNTQINAGKSPQKQDPKPVKIGLRFPLKRPPILNSTVQVSTVVTAVEVQEMEDIVDSSSKNNQEAEVTSKIQSEKTVESSNSQEPDAVVDSSSKPTPIGSKEKIGDKIAKGKFVIIKAVPKNKEVVPISPSKTITPKTPTKEVSKNPDPAATSTMVQVESSPTKKIAKNTDVATEKPTSQKPAQDVQLADAETATKSTLNETVPAMVVQEVQPAATKVKQQSPLKESCPKSPPKEPIKTPIKESLESATIIKSPNLNSVRDNLIMSKVVTETDTEKVVSSQDSSEQENSSNEPSSSIPMEVSVEVEASNDSQLDNSEVLEKEHNKSISRELKSLIKSAKDSKIISECTQLTSKIRKSRTPLDTSTSSLNTSTDGEKLQRVRRYSSCSQKSNCSGKSEKAIKRSMRSQNPDFVNKVKLFLNSVTGKKSEDGIHSDEEDETKKEKNEIQDSASTPKRTKLNETVVGTKKLRSDMFCWRCHWTAELDEGEKTHPPLHCTVCPRTFHFKCISGPERSKINDDKSWVCPECLLILHAESSETRSPAMKKISLGMLCELLQYALERMMDTNGVEPFMNPVDRATFPEYDKYVVHPMYLNLLKQNIANGLYGSTEAFQIDAQWILHNSIIFNTCESIGNNAGQKNLQSKLTSVARVLLRSCKTEMSEIEACPECYAGAHARRSTWFTDVCSTPHILLWAKLKGFPYWPAKGMSVSSSGLVDVRFFGAHDRAWVPARDCCLYSEKDPNNFRNKRQDIMDSMQEAELHIRNISKKFGKFVYPPYKTQFEPSKFAEQLKLMIPNFEGEIKSPKIDKKETNSSPIPATKKRSHSKTRSSLAKGDASDGEDNSILATKIGDGADIAIEDSKKGNEAEVLKQNTLTKSPSTRSLLITSQPKDVVVLRKRRKSCFNLRSTDVNKDTALDTSVTTRKRRKSTIGGLEEAVVPVTDSPREKRKRTTLDTSVNDENKKSQKAEPIKESTPKPKDTKTNESKPKEDANVSNLKDDSTPKRPPIKLVISPKLQKATFKSSTPKIQFKVSSPKSHKVKTPKTAEKLNKSNQNDSKDKVEKRQTSRANKSLNSSNTTQPAEKKNVKTSDSKSSPAVTPKNTDKAQNKHLSNTGENDDHTSLADIARNVAKNNIVPSSVSGLPTITSVRSLSNTSKAVEANKNRIIDLDSNSDSIFTPTSTNSVRTAKEAVNKLQKLRNESETNSLVGKVGVRAFARMTSPPREPNKSVEVEIKTEPIELEEGDRQMEKLDLMKSFSLRPVSHAQVTSNLREIRISKVVSAPIKKTLPQVTEARPMAKKSFPQPKKPEENRSELNGKNSMVYIPIQPPVSQAPVRTMKVNTTSNGPVISVQGPRFTVPAVSTNQINTITSPIMTSSTTPTPIGVVTNAPFPHMPTIGHISNIGQLQTVTQLPAMGTVPTIGQLGPTVGPTNVHTVPLITSVNGQWTFSLQPIMSVGGADSSSPTLVNGVADRSSAPLVNTPTVTALPSTPSNRLEPPSVEPPPRLQQRPIMSPLEPVQLPVPTPSTAGPVSARLNQCAVRLRDFFRTVLEETLERMDDPASQLTTLKLQLEHAKWKHQQEMDEVKHNFVLSTMESRQSFEKEKIRAVSEAKRLAQMELDSAVMAAKSKQWCANCSQEAQFYCCWNTSYCDYPCQRAHWTSHFLVCTQQNKQGNISSDSIPTTPQSRLQPQPDHLPKSVPPNTPMLVAAKPNRTRTPNDKNTKASLVMSLVQDSSGTKSLKCVGLYNPSACTASQSSHKQTTNNDNSGKVASTNSPKTSEQKEKSNNI